MTSRLYLDDQLAVLLELRINSDQMQRLADSLGDEKAVKWISMVERQLRD